VEGFQLFSLIGECFRDLSGAPDIIPESRVGTFFF
jgi:hypothetical protein